MFVPNSSLQKQQTRSAHAMHGHLALAPVPAAGTLSLESFGSSIAIFAKGGVEPQLPRSSFASQPQQTYGAA